jgi:hypothetical protein
MNEQRDRIRKILREAMNGQRGDGKISTSRRRFLGSLFAFGAAGVNMAIAGGGGPDASTGGSPQPTIVCNPNTCHNNECTKTNTCIWGQHL